VCEPLDGGVNVDPGKADLGLEMGPKSMTVTNYLALLRGINVGGKNLIKMGDLKSFLETQRLTDVSTYIQSGNVLFASNEPAPALAARIEDCLFASVEA